MDNLDGKFYLGRKYDLKKGEITDENLYYDSEDLTTHAVVVGMTGSGKTGLCIGMLEEGALNGIPALMIDPKGDITNALLHFPDLLPSDFQPWVNPDDARREGKTIEQAATDAAQLWQNGLKKWGIGRDRIQALRDSAQFTIYTPGSDSGIPVNILASLKSPEIPWEGNSEIIREKITGTVTALLGLIGLTDIDPVRSREHILMSNIFENSWSQSQDLDLAELILQIQNPPFKKLGVFDIDAYFPEKDRFELSMLLNNILAAPAFQSWISGQPLDIHSLLYCHDGRPRHSVFYIAHLSDSERMFFVTLLYSAVETWMRTQKGTTSLRAIVYFDEIFGYLPPLGNPPSKMPMLRMLKQARAFGVGQVLVTQNPVDLDYKGLSNTGTWFIGKLQTERDKDRLLDGLEGASPGIDRKTYDRQISTLDKRVFLLHNIHEKEPALFHTRWVMNYLTGPLTRAQIPALNKLADALGVDPTFTPSPKETRRDTYKAQIETSGPSDSVPISDYGSLTRPNIPGRVGKYFLPNNLTLSEAIKTSLFDLPFRAETLGIVYRPSLLAQATIRFLNPKYNLDTQDEFTVLIREAKSTREVSWEEWAVDAFDSDTLDRKPLSEARFAPLEGVFSNTKELNTLETGFVDWIYYEHKVNVLANETLKIYAGPQISESVFKGQLLKAANEVYEEELEKIEASYKKKIDTIEERLRREERDLDEDKTELSQRKLEEIGTHAENILSLFAGRRRKMTTSLTKRRMTSKAKADVEESLETIKEYKKDIEELETDYQDEVREIKDKWDQVALEVTKIPVTPYKKDILVKLFGIAWFPYYLVDSDGRILELPAFKV